MVILSGNYVLLGGENTFYENEVKMEPSTKGDT